MREVIVFDVNETLLDLSPLAPAIEELMPADAMSDWFMTLLLNSMVASMTDSYRDFDQLGVAALLTVGEKRGLSISPEVARSIVDGMAGLPAHHDVVPALERLRGAGYRMATLSNSSSSFLARQMSSSGLEKFFEEAISVEEVGRFKPAPEPYFHAATRLGVPIDRVRLVAAHDWDVTGAIRAGAKAAFVARHHSSPSSVSELPDIVVPDLFALADVLVGRVSR